MERARKFTRRSILEIGAGSGIAFTVLGLMACQPAPAPTATPAPKPTEVAKPAEAPKPTTAPAPAATTAPAPTTAPAAKPTEVPAAKPAAKSATGTVRYQNRSDDVTIKAETEVIQSIFEKNNPGIKVAIEPAPDGRDEKLITAMVGGNAPDVFESWSDNVTQFADRGQVTDVEPLVKRDFTADDLKDFYPWQWRDFSIPTAQGSKIRFGLPKYVNVMVLWYNKDMFDKAGIKYPDDTWTHDTYAEVARKLTVKKGDQIESFGLHYPVWSWDRYWYKIEAWGGLVRDPNDDTKATFDSPEALAAFEWSRKLLWDDKAMAQRLLLLGTGTSYNATALFATGKFAMNEDGFYPFSMARNIEKKIRWGWAHTPPGPKGRKVLGTTDGYVMWKNSKVPDAAWELVKYLSGPDHQKARNKVVGNLPVRFSALADWKESIVKAYPELADANPDIGPKIMEMGYAGNRQFFKKDAEARQIVVPALEKVFQVGNTPVTYFKEIAEQVTKKMRS